MEHNGGVPAVLERRPTPEGAVEQPRVEGDQQVRGRLKIFLGYASGVGKSFRMIDEGRRRHERGQDVVVGAIQPKLSDSASHALSTLEVIPQLPRNGTMVMDIPAILRRSPKVCLVDGLAYDNPPGSAHDKRWQDVAQLLSSGICVITSVNLQHIAEKAAAVEAITGKHVDETVPLAFLQTADEIVVVDAPPENCSCCVGDGKPGTSQNLSQLQLSELREIALLLAADVVDKQLERYLARHGLHQTWGTQERILVWLSPQSDSERMLASGARNRDRFHGELIVTHMNRPEWSNEERKQIETGVSLAAQKGAEVIPLPGDNAVDAILQLARQRGVTQIYVGHKSRENWWERAFGTDVDRLIRAADGIDVRVFPHA